MLQTLTERHAAERPHAQAFVERGAVFTWRDVHDRTARLAAGLATAGVGPGDTVGILLPNSAAFCITLIAVGRLGAIALPIGNDLTAPEITRVLETADARVLIAEDGRASLCRDLLRQGALDCACLRTADMDDARNLARLMNGPAVPIGTTHIDPNAEAIRQLTSGTTGEPKLMTRAWRGLFAMARAYQEALGTSADDRLLAKVPFSHGHGRHNVLLAGLYAGATLVLQERFDRRETLRLLDDERVTIFTTTPFACAVLAGTRRQEARPFPTVRWALCGGTPLSRDLWTRTRDRLGLELRQIYGTTETGTLSVNVDGDAEETALSVGRPLSGVTWDVVDDSGAPCAPGVAGTVIARSPWAAEVVAAGRRISFGAGDDLRVGDTGYRDGSGRLYVTGPAGIVVKIGGFRVNPAAVEEVLIAHPAVADAAVFARHDASGDGWLNALVVPAGSSCNLDDLIAHCRARLADHQVPRTITMVRDIPRTASGKIRRGMLARGKLCRE